jgi:hypothetical protein
MFTFSSVVGFPAAACVICGNPSPRLTVFTCRAKILLCIVPVPNAIESNTHIECVSIGVSLFAAAWATL